MTRLVLAALEKRYKRPSGSRAISSEVRINMAREVVKLFAKLIKTGDIAQLGLAGSQLDEDLETFFADAEERFGVDVFVGDARKFIVSRLCAKTIAYEDSKKQIQRLAITDEQHQALKANIPHLNDIFYVCKAKRDLNSACYLHEAYFSDENKAYHQAVALSTGMIIDSKSGDFTLDDIEQTIKESVIVTLLHGNKQRGRGLSIDLNQEPPFEYYHALKLMSVDYLSEVNGQRAYERFDKLKSVITPSLGEIDSKEKPFSQFLYDDSRLCIEYATSSKSLSVTIERCTDLLYRYRPILERINGEIVAKEQCLRHDDRYFRKLNEDTLIIRAAAAHIDKLCHSLAKNFQSVESRVDINALVYKLTEFFAMHKLNAKDSTRMVLSPSVVAKAIYDHSLPGVVDLMVKVLNFTDGVQSKEIKDKLNRNIDALRDSLPIPALGLFIKKSERKENWIDLIIKENDFVCSGCNFSLLPGVTIPLAAKFFADIEKAHPKFISTSSAYEKFCRDLKLNSPLVSFHPYFEASLEKNFYAEFAKEYYNSAMAESGVKHAEAPANKNMDFLKQSISL